MAKEIVLKGQTFTLGKFKGKHLRAMSKLNCGDEEKALKMIEIVLGVDESFVDDLEIEEIELVVKAIEEVMPQK